MAYAKPERPTSVLGIGKQDSRGAHTGPSPAPQVLVPWILRFRHIHQGLTPYLRIKAKGFENQAAKTKPQTSSPIPLPVAGGGVGPHPPVENGGAVTAHGCVAVEGEQHVTLSAELTYETLGLAPLGVGLGASQCCPRGHLKPGCTTLPAPGARRGEMAGPQWGTHLTIQLDVLGEERVGLGERAAQAARVGIQEVLD